ncbi:SNF2-related protein [Pirellulaceae bacterium SH449]
MLRLPGQTTTLRVRSQVAPTAYPSEGLSQVKPMGLGKTIQGIGTAELFARLAGIKNVLVVCPASLKRQWASEVQRFSGRSCNIALWSASDRAEQYRDASFFKIANYEQVLRDEAVVQSIHWDLIILDEGQRINSSTVIVPLTKMGESWDIRTSSNCERLCVPSYSAGRVRA